MAAINRRRLLMLILLRRRLARGNERRRLRRFWVRQIFRERKEKGEYHTLVKETMLFDHEYFFRMFRMSPTKYETLLQWLAPFLVRSNVRREAIGPGERLCVTLRFLVTGDAFATIAHSYRMSETTVGRIVKDTCEVIWNVLKDKGFLKVPGNQNDWTKIADEFEKRWNFPNCLGAIDGKHVIIQCPPRGGSKYFNYKKFHSIVLMAVVNANYEFTMVDVGDYGRLSDGSVFGSCDLGIAIEQQRLNMPPPRVLPGSNVKFPYVFVGDDAFPLKTNVMKPYPRGHIEEKEKIANCRLSRARRIVENAFGIATSRFRVFRRAICANVETAQKIVKAVLAVHNFLMYGRSFSTSCEYCPADFIDSEVEGTLTNGGWRNNSATQAMLPISQMGSNNYSRSAKETRDNFRDYFCSAAGSVPWQLNAVRSTQDLFDENQ